MVLRKVVSCLREQVGIFQLTDISPHAGIRMALVTFFGWALSAVFVVLFTTSLGKFRSTTYFNDAISEGIGPHLWNIVGIVGLVFLGMFIIAPQKKVLAVVADNILVNAYAIGSLTFGLLFGQWLMTFPSQNFVRWQAWAYGAGVSALFATVAALNLLLWYLSFLVTHDQFTAKLVIVDIRIRFVAGAFCIVAPLGSLLSER